MPGIINYVLIDLENIQPKNLNVLNGHDFKVLVFIGAKQSKISIDMAEALHALGSDAEYIRVSGTASDALDFHIAFYIGELSKTTGNNYFHIISKDKGFDPLITHLRGRKIRVQRHRDILSIPLLKIANATSVGERISAIVDHLRSRGSSKPRKVKTLSNSINALFLKRLSEKELESLVTELVKRKIVLISDTTNVSYKLPDA